MTDTGTVDRKALLTLPLLDLMQEANRTRKELAAIAETISEINSRLSLMSCNDAIRALCIFRIILKDKIIKIAAGRETVLKDFQAMGFMAGANGMIIGGYLTIKGRVVESDQQLIREIQALWET